MNIPLQNSVRLLQSREGVFALEKPSGVRSHPNKKGVDSRSIIGLPYDFEKEAYLENGIPRWFLINRLDAPTSGVLLVSDSVKMAENVKAVFANREVSKVYHAIVFGRPRNSSERWEDRLEVLAKGKNVRTQLGRGEKAISNMSLVESSKHPPLLSLLELSPKTGRTHQLRVQTSSRRLPIVGDATYGNFKLNRQYLKSPGMKRLYLHSSAIEFNVRVGTRTVKFNAQSELPKSFRALIRGITQVD